jgi:hypothetical protein
MDEQRRWGRTSSATGDEVTPGIATKVTGTFSPIKG